MFIICLHFLIKCEKPLNDFVKILIVKKGSSYLKGSSDTVNKKLELNCTNLKFCDIRVKITM